MDDYSGHVEQDGAAATRTIRVDESTVEIRKLSVGPMDNGVYLLSDVEIGESLIVDAANDADRILAELGDRKLISVVLTHGDPDHWQAVEAVKEATDAFVWIHPDDEAMMTPRADRHLADGAHLQFGHVSVAVLHTPGHTPGSCCFLLGDTHLFSGDTLFPGGPGRTDRDIGDFDQVMRSLRDKLFVLPDETWVYPGHGDDTTIGAERPHLDEWQARGW